MRKQNRKLSNLPVRASEVVAASGANELAVVTAGAPIGNKNASKGGGTAAEIHQFSQSLPEHVFDDLEAHAEAIFDHFHQRPDFNDALKELAKMNMNVGRAAKSLIKASDTSEDEGAVHASETVQCKASGAPLAPSALWECDKPCEFQWLPGGISTINASYNGSPIELTVQCDEETAPAVQASFEDWCKRDRQECFGCVEHREAEASVRLPRGVGAFTWKDEPEPGVFCRAVPTELGARNVNGRIHRSWSPSFTTDADYASATERNGTMVFPAYARGSKQNPARVTGVAFSVGSLVNKPAFRNILPVRAKETTGDEVVTAAGTSEGVRKSWEVRNRAGGSDSKKAHELETEANLLSKEASSKPILDDSRENYPTYERFKEGAELAEKHRLAQHSFEAAGMYHHHASRANGISNKDAEYHKDKSIENFNRADTHKAAANRLPSPYAVGTKQSWELMSGLAPNHTSSTETNLAINAEQTPQSETNNADKTQQGQKMKLHVIRARDGHAAGTTVELADDLAFKALVTGDYRTEADHALITARDGELTKMRDKQKAQNLGKITAALDRAVARKAIFPKGDGEKALETVKAKHMAAFDEGRADADTIVELIDYLPGDEDKKILARQTNSVNAREGGNGRVTLISGDIKDAGKAYVTAREPMQGLIRAGRMAEARQIATESGVIMRYDIMEKINAHGGDVLLRDVIHAASFTDPDSQVGTLAGDLVLQHNLGYLVNKLNFMKYVSTDLSSEPAKFGQAILTRYITPPNVLTWVPGVGFTSDTTTIATAGTGTTQHQGTQQGLAGTPPAAGNLYLQPVKSVPSTTDVSVVMNMFKATEIEFPISKIAGTVRNLFQEQRGAQMYSLAEHISSDFLAKLYAASWSRTFTRSLDDWSLKGMIGIKNAMTIAKLPDMGRYILAHPFYHDKLLEDSNMLQAQAILALINKDASSFNSTDLPPLFGIKILETQLSSATDAGVLTTWTDSAAPGTTNIFGFAGNMSSMLFVSRPPQDWTTTASQLGIPTTASVEIVTEPESGLSVMVFKYADNGKMSLNQRVCLMWGAAQGDPRQGILLKIA